MMIGVCDMKNLLKITAAAAAIAMLAACTADNETAGVASAETEIVAETAAETSKAPETPEEFHAAMVDRSLYSLGNVSRLKQKIEKARSGEDVTIAYIGGSITEGLTAGSENCYARLSCSLFEEKFAAGGKVNYINAGLSGTPSNLGVLRLDRDVLSHEPDIVFVEFAVNDSQDKLAKESYESLVKTVLSQDNAPAAVLLFNVIESGYTAQAHMKEIGEFYDLPMISAADALTEEFDSKRLTWDDYSDDQSHPNAYGHKLLCEFIGNMYTAADNAPDSGEYTVRQGGLFGTPYENAEMIVPSAPDAEGIAVSDTGSFVPSPEGTSGFNESWKYDGGEAPLKLNVTANAFFVIYKRGNSDDYGSFDVYLDGEKLKTVNTCQKDGWGEAYSEQIIKFQSVKDMDIEIRPSEGSEDKDIRILGFAYSQNTTF